MEKKMIIKINGETFSIDLAQLEALYKSRKYSELKKAAMNGIQLITEIRKTITEETEISLFQLGRAYERCEDMLMFVEDYELSNKLAKNHIWKKCPKAIDILYEISQDRLITLDELKIVTGMNEDELLSSIQELKQLLLIDSVSYKEMNRFFSTDNGEVVLRNFYAILKTIQD